MDRHDAGVTQLGEPARLLEELLSLACGTSGPPRSTLIATGRSSCVSWPRYTAPKPPVPNAFRTW